MLLCLLFGLSGCKTPEKTAESNNLGRVKTLIARGEYPEAFLQLNQALAEAPNDPAIHQNLGWLYLYTDDLPHVQQELSELEKLAPNQAETLHFRGAVAQYRAQRLSRPDEAKREHETAVADFRKALTKDPDNYRTYFDLAVSLNALNRSEEALDILDQGFDRIPRSDLDTQVDFQIASCDAHARLKMFDEAIADCQQAYEFASNPTDRERIEEMVQNMKLLNPDGFASSLESSPSRQSSDASSAALRKAEEKAILDDASD